VYRKRDNGHVPAAMQLHGVLKRLFEYAVELQLVTINAAAMVAESQFNASVGEWVDSLKC
jgi:uncharacterized protein (DUF952 family)